MSFHIQYQQDQSKVMDEVCPTNQNKYLTKKLLKVICSNSLQISVNAKCASAQLSKYLLRHRHGRG